MLVIRSLLPDRATDRSVCVVAEGMALTTSGLCREPLREQALLGESAAWRSLLPAIRKGEELIGERCDQLLDPAVVDRIHMRTRKDRDLGGRCCHADIQRVSEREQLWSDRSDPDVEF